MAAWQELPDAGEVVLGELLGWPGAVAVQLAVLAGLYALVLAWERSGNSSSPSTAPAVFRQLSGPWPLMAAAVILALLNFATPSVAGHPWSITWGMTLWAAKAALAFGWDPSSTPFWRGDFQEQALRAGVLDDITSVMNIGIVLGAFIAAALPGHWIGARLRPRFGLAL